MKLNQRDDDDYQMEEPLLSFKFVGGIPLNGFQWFLIFLAAATLIFWGWSWLHLPEQRGLLREINWFLRYWP